MANREKGEFDIIVGDRTYTMVLNTNAMCELEEVFSTPDREYTAQALMQKVNTGSTRYVVAFIWACLREHHAEMTKRDVTRLIDEVGLVGLNNQLQALAKTAQPDPADVKEINAANPPTAQVKAKRKRGIGGPFKSMHATPA
jgi:hypothetical protein